MGRKSKSKLFENMKVESISRVIAVQFELESIVLTSKQIFHRKTELDVK